MTEGEKLLEVMATGKPLPNLRVKTKLEIVDNETGEVVWCAEHFATVSSVKQDSVPVQVRRALNRVDIGWDMQSYLDELYGTPEKG